MSFLSAEWRKLAIANYRFDPTVLKKHLPAKTELDFWNGECYLSLVGFMFLNTRLLGIPIPFHRNFEEVNLRFYVRHKHQDQWKRGVVFIKEIVPKPALAFIANNIYKEHYQTMPMSHSWAEADDHRSVEYRWESSGKKNFFSVKATIDPCAIPENSETEFITEHYWGYTMAGSHSTYEYQVKHPRWKTYEVLDQRIQVNFRSVYGDDFSLLSSQMPASVMLAEGSEITVGYKRRL